MAKLLALVGSINDDVIADRNELVNFGLNYLVSNYPGLISSRYDVDENSSNLIEEIARKKLWLLKQNEIDYDKAIDSILKDIRSDKLGKVTWEKC